MQTTVNAVRLVLGITGKQDGAEHWNAEAVIHSA